MAGRFLENWNIMQIGGNKETSIFHRDLSRPTHLALPVHVLLPLLLVKILQDRVNQNGLVERSAESVAPSSSSFVANE